MWGKTIIPMYRLWLNGLHGLYGPRCPLSPKRPINLISLSLMPWCLASPGHQQPWYWLCRIGRSLFYLRKDFNNLCQINVEEWHKNVNICLFPLKNFAPKSLIHAWPSLNWLIRIITTSCNAFQFTHFISYNMVHISSFKENSAIDIFLSWAVFYKTTLRCLHKIDSSKAFFYHHFS